MAPNIGRRTLYHSPTSVCSQKVRLVLADLDLPWESVVLDLAGGDQFKPDYKRLNPAAVVPTLVEDDEITTESNTIMRHLCAQVPDAPLTQASQLKADACTIWLDNSLELHAAINALTYASINRPKLLQLSSEKLEQRYASIPDPARANRLRQIVELGFESPPFVDALRTLNRLLPLVASAAGNSKYLGGGELTLADYAVLSFIIRLELLGLAFTWQNDFPALQKWLDTMKSTSSYQTAIGDYHTAKRLQKFAKCPETSALQIAQRWAQ